MEALCAPTSSIPPPTLTLCLQSVDTVLGDQWPRSQIGQDHSLAVEVLNVLHRLVLTQEDPASQNLVAKIAGKIILSSQEALEERMAR